MFEESISDPNRRIFAGMLYKLDESVGKVVAALKENNMLQDSVIVFTTDNGGPASGFNQNAASNFPLKGVSPNSLVLRFIQFINALIHQVAWLSVI